MQPPPPPSGQPPKAAEPLHGAKFDPWNSSSTGHQRPEQNPGTGWRQSRNRKLNSQFAGGAAGGERLSDTYGAGSEDWDDKHRTLIPKAVRERAQRNVRDMLVRPGKMRKSLESGDDSSSSRSSSSSNSGRNSPVKDEGGPTGEEKLAEKRRREDEEREERKGARGLFDGVVVYVNGSTFPLVSDHKLKHILTENGASMSLHLGRRQVTHVILGKAVGGGGGLAGSKMEKEMKKIRGTGVKFVGVEWVLESLKAGKRLPEARFSCASVAREGQASVYGLFAKQGGSKA